jgi:hypothetical protein
LAGGAGGTEGEEGTGEGAAPRPQDTTEGVDTEGAENWKDSILLMKTVSPLCVFCSHSTLLTGPEVGLRVAHDARRSGVQTFEVILGHLAGIRCTALCVRACVLGTARTSFDGLCDLSVSASSSPRRGALTIAPALIALCLGSCSSTNKCQISSYIHYNLSRERERERGGTAGWSTAALSRMNRRPTFETERERDCPEKGLTVQVATVTVPMYRINRTDTPRKTFATN